MQEIGRTLSTTGMPIGARIKWRWPNPTGAGEVKGFPSIIVGGRPGSKSPDHRPGWDHWIRLPDGLTDTVDKYGAVLTATEGGTASDLSLNGGGFTPASGLPLQLPLTGGLTFNFDWKHNIVPTGLGHLTFDIWCTRVNDQVLGFTKAPITHEIMMPLCNWGNYGSYGYRNPTWYDHEAPNIGGKPYWVYITKNNYRNDVTGVYGTLQPGFRYNFSGLDPMYTNPETGQPAIGWKMIAFLPQPLPDSGNGLAATQSGHVSIDLVPIINYCRTQYDSRGIPWMSGNEFLMSVEIGVEPQEGSGDITLYNFDWVRT
jgi:hypothetical protein